MPQDHLTPDTELVAPPLPLSAHRSRAWRGRPFNTSTPLGQIMKRQQLRVTDVASMSGMSERKLSDLLAGRKPIKPVDAVYLARALSVTIDDIMGTTGPRPIP